MSIRSEAQVLGSQGQSLVAHLINSSGDWIVRAQDEDFGIDLEAELSTPYINGQLIKIQVKASRSVEISEKGVVCQIPKKLAVYADGCRLPVIFVRVDLERQEAWYLWLQHWLLERQRSGLLMQDLSESTTYYIAADRTLSRGLSKDLRDIAQWQTRTQLVLTVYDAIRTSAAVYDYEVLNHLVTLLDRLGIANEHFPINLVIEKAIALGNSLWATPEGSQASRSLYVVCRHFGRKFSADQIWRMVSRGNSISRTGLNALGILYDEHYDHIAALNLVALLLAHPDKRAAFYCHLRELKPKASFSDCLEGGYGVLFADMAVHESLKEDFDSKWPNRGDSVLLDYLYLSGNPDDTVPSTTT